MDNIIQNDSTNITEPKISNAEKLIMEAEQKYADRFKGQSSPDYKIPNRIIGNANNPRIEFHIDGNDDNVLDELNSQNVVMEFDLQTLKGVNESSLSQLWDGYFPDKLGYVPKDYEIAEIRNEMLEKALKEHGKTMKDYMDTMKSGDDTGATFKLVKEVGAWDTYRNLALTRAYYQFNDFKDDYIERQLSQVQRSEVKGNSMIQGELSYEYQGHNNCYACSLAGIYNNFLNRDSSITDEQRQNAPKLDQYKVRSFTPRYLNKNEIKELNPDSDDGNERQRLDIEEFAGEGKTAVGSVIAISDVVFESPENGGMGRTDIAVVEKTYGMDRVANDDIAKKNLLQGIKQTIHDAINSGQMVSFLSHRHYVTVVGLEGDTLKILDSNTSNYNKAVSVDLESYIKRGGSYSAVELSFLRKIGPNELETLKQEYSGLGINEATGEVVRTNGLIKENDIAHRAGIVIAKNSSDIINANDGDIKKYMSESIALHKTAFMTDPVQKKNWKEKTDAGWQESKKQWQEFLDLQRKRRAERRAKAERERRAREAEERQKREALEREQREAEEKQEREHQERLEREAEEDKKAMQDAAEFGKQMTGKETEDFQEIQNQLQATMNRRHSAEFGSFMNALGQMNERTAGNASNQSIRESRELVANLATDYCMRKVRQNKSSYDAMEAARLGNTIDVLKELDPKRGKVMEDLFGMRTVMEGDQKNYEFRKIPDHLLNAGKKGKIDYNTLEDNVLKYRSRTEETRDINLVLRGSIGILKAVKDADPALMKSSKEYRAFRNAAQKLTDELSMVTKDANKLKILPDAKKQDLFNKIKDVREKAILYQAYKKSQPNLSKIAQKRIAVSEKAIREAEMMDDVLRTSDRKRAYRRDSANAIDQEVNYIRKNRNVSPENIAKIIVLKSAANAISNGESRDKYRDIITDPQKFRSQAHSVMKSPEFKQFMKNNPDISPDKPIKMSEVNEDDIYRNFINVATAQRNAQKKHSANKSVEQPTEKKIKEQNKMVHH